MAAVVAIQTAFQRLGFNASASNILSDPNKENIDLESLQCFDDNRVKSLCATLRKPGGTIAGPVAADGSITAIPNPGVYVASKAEMNLMSACFMARHYQRTQRILTTTDVVMPRIQRFTQFKEAEEAYKEPSDTLKLIKPEKIMDFIDDWPDHIALYNGQQGRPLSYVLRESATVKPEADEPSFGETNTTFVSLRDEITTRASHQGMEFSIDNARVFELLNDAVNEHKNVKTWINPFAKRKDGRGAWLAFKSHYRGSSEMESIEVAAEKQLTSLIYSGERQRYSFETHVSKHRKAHQELEKATGAALPDGTKVRRLLDSLQVASLAVPIATIKAQDNLRLDFDACVNFLKSFILSSPNTEQRNVSAVRRERYGKRRGGGNKYNGRTVKGKDKSSLDRYYKPEEWHALSDETKKEIVEARRKRKIAQVNSPGDETVKTSNVQTTQRKKKSTSTA
jgi:hypothetical protein